MYKLNTLNLQIKHTKCMQGLDRGRFKVLDGEGYSYLLEGFLYFVSSRFTRRFVRDYWDAKMGLYGCDSQGFA
jgi:hypothetical protein